MPTFFKHGDHNVVCDYCGYNAKASECRYTWDGFFVHAHCWEPRQPQDFVRGVRDVQTVTPTRPQVAPVFINPGDVTAGDL